MKTLIAAAILALASSASAEMYNAQVECVPTNEFMDMMVQYEIEPRLISDEAIVIDENGNDLEGIQIIWTTDDLGVFVTTFTPESNIDITCIVTKGANLTTWEE